MSIVQTDMLQNIDTNEIWYVSNVKDDKVYGTLINKGGGSAENQLLKGSFRIVGKAHGEYDRLEQTIPPEPIILN